MPSRRELLALAALLGLPSGVRARPEPVLEWTSPVELARGAGVRGPWQQNESRYDFVDDPALALRDDGSMVAAWVDQRRKAVRVQRLRPDGGADGPPLEVAGEAEAFSWIPRLAIVPGAPDTVLLLWQEIIFSGGSHGGDMLLARSTDGGRTFSNASNLSSSVGGDGKGRITPEVWHNGSYDLLALPGGRVFVAWTEYDGPLWVARSTDAGRTFGRPRRVDTGSPRPARAPSLAFAGGALLLAWTEGDQPAADIRIARSADGERFEASTVMPTPGYSDAPRMALDGRGIVHLAWGEASGGPFSAQRVLYTRSRDAGRHFDAPRAVGGALPAGAVSAGFPSLAVDGRGTVVLLAELQDDVRQRPRGIGIMTSHDGGENFGPMALVPHSRDPGGGFNGSSQGLLLPKLALNARGDLVVANSALREGSHSRVWLVRGRLPT